MQAGVITPEVGGADMHRGGVGECSEILEVYQLWGRDLPGGSHCSGTLELVPPKATVVCLRTPFGGPFCHMQAGVITP